MIDVALLPLIKPGATVRVFERVKEGDKERISRFEGLVLARKHGNEPGATFTVRTTLAGVGVEKVFPIYAPTIQKIEVMNAPRKVSRAKIYYVRKLSRKGVRKKIGSAVTRSPRIAQEPEKAAVSE